MDMSKHKFPKKLGRHLYTLISEGVKMMGTFNPGEIFCIFEENLTGDECRTAWGFLTWVHETNIGLGKWEHGPREFGSGNYEQRYQEFLASRK